MTDWHDPKTKLPDDGQECLLLPHQQGLITSHVYGPIMWRAEMADGCWLDIFATAEAGELIRPDQVRLWTLWDPIAPREDDDDE
jgi:hypothetical protein